jgi:hypothetical protein
VDPVATIRPEITGRRGGDTAVEAERSIVSSADDSSETESSESIETDDGGEAESIVGAVEIEPLPPKKAAASPSRVPPKARGPPAGAYTIRQFCAAHSISEAFFYVLRARGEGPRMMRLGRRRLISLEEARRWREAHTAKEAAK